MKIGMILLGLLVTSVLPLQAEVKLPGFFGDNMVLQREAPVKIWGWADKNEPVQVHFNGQVKKTKANRAGEWSVLLDPMSAGGPYTLRVEGKDNRIDYGNILVGEVWLCSGQSNMEWIVANSAGAEQEIADASNYPEIRALNVTKKMHCIPQTDFAGKWEVSSPATVGSFSAVAYFYARSLYRELGVPIGIINSSWGGTDIECWISPDRYAQLPDKIKLPYNQELIEAVHRSVDENNGSMDAYTEGFVYDEGIRRKWYEPNADDASWTTIEMPNPWNEAPLSNPKSAQGPATLYLGQIDDDDICWINGTQVGSTKGWGIHRQYNVPENVWKPGENSIVVRVTDEMGGGGFLATPDKFYIEWNEDEPVSVNLSGTWKYAQGISDEDFRKVLLNPNNIHSLLYNAMIHPLTPMTIKGVIWYQGENNAGRATAYQTLFPTLISDWRDKWKSELPFYWVQLANFMAKDSVPSESDWANLREAQTMTLSLPKTGQAVIIDIGEANDIHPKNKQDVGWRLALHALHNEYGRKDLIVSAPTYQSLEKQGNKLVLTFDMKGSTWNLHNKYGYIEGFAIAGADKQFHWAKAQLAGDRIEVWSDDVPYPEYVRFAWGNNPDVNLFNAEGLPLAPFRTDK